MKTNIIKIDADEIVVRTSEEHEFLLDSKQVALGYGVSEALIRKHKQRHADELIAEKHWTTVTNSHGGEGTTLWTKRGVIRLGFFIRSERAKRFRDAAEDLVLRETTQSSAPHLTSFLEKVVTSLGNLMETQKQIVAQQGELIKATVDHERRLSDNAEGYRRLVLGHHNMQARIDALEAKAQPPVHSYGSIHTVNPDGTTHTVVLPRRGVIMRPRYAPEPAVAPATHAAAPATKFPLFNLLDIDRALFTPESADWWVGTSSQLRAALAKTGIHLRQLGLRSLARQYPNRCVDLTSIARGKQRAYAIFRPGFTPDSLAMTLIRQELRQRLSA